MPNENKDVIRHEDTTAALPASSRNGQHTFESDGTFRARRAMIAGAPVKHWTPDEDFTADIPGYTNSVIPGVTNVNDALDHIIANQLPITDVKTDDYVLLPEDYTVRCNDAGLGENKAITLPAASGCLGRIINVNSIGGNEVYYFELTPDGSDTIQSQAFAVPLVTSGEGTYFHSITVQSDGVSDWIILNRVKNVTT